jgi:hypothetical protein
VLPVIHPARQSLRPAEHSTEAQDGRPEWPASDSLADERDVKFADGVLQLGVTLIIVPGSYTFLLIATWRPPPLCRLFSPPQRTDDILHGLSLQRGCFDYVLRHCMAFTLSCEMAIHTIYHPVIVCQQLLCDPEIGGKG